MFSWRNLQNKMDTFYYFESSIHFASICFANFSMKTRSTEKMEYTTTKPTENPSKLSSQFFYFWNFVTEIFRHKVMLKIIISSIEKCTNFLINSSITRFLIKIFNSSFPPAYAPLPHFPRISCYYFPTSLRTVLLSWKYTNGFVWIFGILKCCFVVWMSKLERSCG